MPYHCKKCDGENVEVQGWVNPNTGIEALSTDVNTDTTWCKDCVESDLGIVYKDSPLNFSPEEREQKQ